MKRWLTLVSIFLFLAGCASQSVKKARSELDILYISELPRSDAEFSALYSSIKSFNKPLVIIDDSSFSTLADLAWWEGEKELFLCDTLGADIFLPPSTWLYLGAEKLKQLSAEADFFIVSLNLCDDSMRYPLPRYMIRTQSPYRLAFSAAAPAFPEGMGSAGLKSLDTDSLLPVTASFLALQSDYFFFFNTDSLNKAASGIESISRGGRSRDLTLSIQSAREFRLKEKPIRPAGQSTLNPYSLWSAKVDSMDSEIIGFSAQGIGRDSLRTLAENILKSASQEGAIVYLGDGFVRDSLPAGDITFGQMRRIFSPEIFLAVSSEDYIASAGENKKDLGLNVKEVIVPSSLFVGNMAFKGVQARPTGLVSGWLAKQMFAKEDD